MANEGAGVGLILGFLSLMGLAVAAVASSQQTDTKRKALLSRIDKEVQDYKDYLKGKE